MESTNPGAAAARAGIAAALVAAGALLVLACSSATTGVDAAVVSEKEAAGAPAPVSPDGTDTPTGESTASPVAAYVDDPEAVAFGRRYFRAICTGYCHSTQPGLARDAPYLFDCDWRHGGTDEEIFRVITEGVPGTEMLPFGEKLEPEVLWKIVAYLRADSRCSG